MKSVTIVGGGLAGLTLGIGLRQRGVPVQVYEAGSYPRHRVCGEFISGRGLETLEKLELLATLRAAGARPATTTAFASLRRISPVKVLPEPAFCVSRFVLDQCFAEKFCELGGDLRCGMRWSGDTSGAGMVRASGRRLHTVEKGWRWYGLKAHARDIRLVADLEMYFLAGGYVGVCRLPGDEINVCGLFRRRAGEGTSAQHFSERLSGPTGSPLHQRLCAATWDESSFCAVAGLSLVPHAAASTPDFAVGDALTMIPPLTGNGMSMAFESAEIALPSLQAYARGEISWDLARAAFTRRCDALFARRLKYAQWLQRSVSSLCVPNLLLHLSLRSQAFWRLFFFATR
jgi:2-polyprenyl-6-methoxyphenol hydroxylase-like FAD-dependent oxidoreductase